MVTFLFRVVLGQVYRGLTGGFLLLQLFSVAFSVSPCVCFILILISMFLRKCTYGLGIFHANQTTKCLKNQSRTKVEGRSKAALLIWFFSDFRCSVLLFIVLLVIYKYRNR